DPAAKLARPPSRPANTNQPDCLAGTGVQTQGRITLGMEERVHETKCRSNHTGGHAGAERLCDEEIRSRAGGRTRRTTGREGRQGRSESAEYAKAAGRRRAEDQRGR